jgi:hypothetical protein
MKKIIFSVLAVAALAACQKNEVICTPDPGAIAFNGAYVDMATRANAAVDPSTTTNTIESFDVWGFMDDATGKVFVGETVTKNGGEWTYKNTQYWAPGHTYYFAALSNHTENTVVNVENANEYGLGNIKFTVTEGDQDLLYAAAGPIAAPAATATSVAPVQLAFNHMLSKVKFTFTNGFTNELATIDVKNIQMEVPATADINVNVADWWSTNCWANYDGTATIAFGDACAKTAIGVSQECDDERIILPAGNDVVYTVTFDVVLYQGDKVAYEGKKTVEIKGVALEIGKAYNFTAELNASNITAEGNELLPIEFTVVEVKDWVQAGEQTGVIEGTVKNQTLMTNVEATETVNLAGTLDGAGHTISAVEGVDYVIANTARLIEATAPSTISNLVIDGKNHYSGEFGIRGIYTIGTGDIKIENVKIVNCTYAINANNEGKLTVVNSTLQGWNSYGATTENHFENVKFIDGKFHNFRPYNNTVCINCDFGEGVVIDLSQMVAGATIKFVNCTVNGQPLTPAALTDTPANVNVAVDMIVTEAPESNALITESASNMTIDGGNFTTTDGKGLRGIYITKGGEYEYDNVVVKNVTYAINVNTTAAVKLTVKNSTLEGWTSYGTSTTASFENVKFTCGKYANYKPYSATTLTNCSFEAGFQIDFTSLDGVLTFKNCTYAGEVMTAENFASLVNIDGDYTGKIAF